MADHHVAIPWVRPRGGLPWNAKALKSPSMPILLVAMGCSGIDPTGMPHDTCLIFVSLLIDPLFSLWEIVERAYENENFSTSASCYTKNKCSQENTVVKNRGLYFGIWRLGGGGREDVVIVTKFNPFFISSHKTSFFLSLSAPEKHYLSKGVYKVFWRTPPIHLNPPSTQRSHPCPDSNLWPRNPASMNITGRPIWRQLKYLHILPRLIGWFWQMKTTN